MFLPLRSCAGYGTLAEVTVHDEIQKQERRNEEVDFVKASVGLVVLFPGDFLVFYGFSNVF